MRNKTWMKLDNAAKIYPAAKSRSWNALFRVSVTMKDRVDEGILQSALENTIKRFPSYALRLRKGFFWYYLEQISVPPRIQPDVQNPCVRMNFRENDGYMFRVRYFNNTISAEFFHVLTDGTGGLRFLKTLAAEYITLKYGEVVPRSDDIADCTVPAPKEELEDSFFKYARGQKKSRKEPHSYRIPGTDTDHFMHIIHASMDSAQVLSTARKYNCTVTELFTAVLVLAIDGIQRDKVHNQNKLEPIKICVPINLRKYYGSNTARNFASYANVGIEPRLGIYTLEETIRVVKGHMAIENEEKQLNAKISTNVSQESGVLRIVPLFIKSPVMKAVFIAQGETLTSSSVSNLGVCNLPVQMSQHIDEMDFMLGPLLRNRTACACLTYNNKMILNFTRSIEESDVERSFFTSLVKLGIQVKLESNGGRDDVILR